MTTTEPRDQLPQAPPPTADRPYLTTADVARLVTLTPQTVREMAAADRLPAMRFGRDWRFDRDELAAWMRDRSNGYRRPWPPAPSAPTPQPRRAKSAPPTTSIDFSKYSDGGATAAGASAEGTKEARQGS